MSSSPARVLAVVNAAAGSARAATVTTALSALRELADVELAATPTLAELARVVADVPGDDLAGGGTRLVLLGGDGTLHAALQALHDAGGLPRLAEVGPVGLVPVGTGNDMARTLGLPVADPAAAARVAVLGRASDMELLVEDDGDVVVNAVHAGIGVSANERGRRAKEVLGRAAYPLGAVAAGAVAGPWHLRVTVDGDVVHTGEAPALMVGLSIGTTIGGGARLSPTASPHDGVVDVMVSTSTGPLARAGYALTMLRGRHVERRDVAVARGRHVVVEALDGEPFLVNADGETQGPQVRYAWDAVPDAWQVVLPPTTPG